MATDQHQLTTEQRQDLFTVSRIVCLLTIVYCSDHCQSYHGLLHKDNDNSVSVIVKIS